MLREVRPERMALDVVHRMLKERPEHFRLHFGPVERGGFAEQDEFVVQNFQPGRFAEQPAVEIADAFEPAAGVGRVGVHGLEQAADQIVGAGRRGTVLQNLRHEIFRQEVNVFGEQRDEHLQDEALRGFARHAALDELAETFRQAIRRRARDLFAVVLKRGLG